MIGGQSKSNVAIPMQLVRKFACSAGGKGTGGSWSCIRRVDPDSGMMSWEIDVCRRRGDSSTTGEDDSRGISGVDDAR